MPAFSHFTKIFSVLTYTYKFEKAGKIVYLPGFIDYMCGRYTLYVRHSPQIIQTTASRKKL